MLTPDNIRHTKFDNGFILPNGDFYACKFARHDQLVDLLYSRPSTLVPPLPRDYRLMSHQIPEEQGWVKLTSFREGSFLFEFQTDFSFESPQAKKITRHQMNTIVDYCISRNRKFVTFNWTSYRISDFLRIVATGSFDKELAFELLLKYQVDY